MASELEVQGLVVGLPIDFILAFFRGTQDGNTGLPQAGTWHVSETRSVRFKQEQMSLDDIVTGKLGWG